MGPEHLVHGPGAAPGRTGHDCPGVRAWKTNNRSIFLGWPISNCINYPGASRMGLDPFQIRRAVSWRGTSPPRPPPPTPAAASRRARRKTSWPDGSASSEKKNDGDDGRRKKTCFFQKSLRNHLLRKQLCSLDRERAWFCFARLKVVTALLIPFLSVWIITRWKSLPLRLGSHKRRRRNFDISVLIPFPILSPIFHVFAHKNSHQSLFLGTPTSRKTFLSYLSRIGEDKGTGGMRLLISRESHLAMDGKREKKFIWHGLSLSSSSACLYT